MWEWRVGAPQQDLLRIFHNGRAIFENGSPGGAILHADHLGSPRVKADVFSPVIRCRDLYSPFGQKHTAPCDAHWAGFTGKERDGETGFDYFGARYCAPIPGRFLSPDPLLDSADPADPQSWNRYSYVFNRPMNSIDPDGRIPIDIANPSAGAPEPEEPIPPGQALGAVLVVVTTLTPIPGDEVGVAAIVGGKLASRVGGKVISAGRKLLNNFFSKTPSSSVTRGRSLGQRVADKARNLPSARRPNTVAVLKSKDGRIVVGRNQGGVTNPQVQSALDRTPPNRFGGACAEVNCIERALNRGVNVRGARIVVVKVRGPACSTGIHGTPKPACSVCSVLLNAFGIGR